MLNRFQATFLSLPLPMAFVSPDGTVALANHALGELAGYSLEKLRGMPWSSLCSHYNSARSAIHLADSWSGLADLIRADGTRCHLHLLVSEMKNEAGAADGYFVIFKDLKQERRSNEPQRQLDKLHSLGTLAGEIAHDLNNILTGVLGHVSFLRLSLPEDVVHAESLAAIEDGARRAASMTQQILRFAREEEVNACPVDLCQVISAGVSLLRGAMPKNIVVDLIGDQRELRVVGDEGRLNQLFMNVAVNARDALPDGGRIEIKLERVVVDSEFDGTRTKLVPGEYGRMTIADNGVGITHDVKERIFEPFFTTKAAKGTGLGLATVFSIVQDYGGAIAVDSEVGSGTRFEIYLPACASGIEQKVVEAERAVPYGSEHVLVVDDEEIVRTVIQRSLEHLGYKVDVAKDGIDAISRYRHNPRMYDLVILDMMMPQMAGDEVFQRLREVDPNARVLLISGYSSEGRAKSVLDAGGLAFIQKPFAVEDLANAVRDCLDWEG